MFYSAIAQVDSIIIYDDSIYYKCESYYIRVLLVYYSSFITSAIIMIICYIILWPIGLLYQHPLINQLVFADLTLSTTMW